MMGSFATALLAIGLPLGNANAAVTTVGFENFTPSTSLTPVGGFPLNFINDGITGSASSFNGFVSNSLGVISFAFNQDYDLCSFILWNDVVVVNEGLDVFSLRFYDSADALITTPASTNYVGPRGQVAPEEYVFLSPVSGVRRVELDVASVQSPSFPTRIEIREVDFGVVPEPSSALLLGLGAFSLVACRRRTC